MVFGPCKGGLTWGMQHIEVFCAALPVRMNTRECAARASCSLHDVLTINLTKPAACLTAILAPVNE